MKELKPAAHPVGTSVLIEDLFFNVPARRKFLKSDLTETRNVIEIVTSYALCHPEAALILSLEGEKVLDVSPSPTVEQRIEDVYGREFIEEKAGPEFERMEAELDDDREQTTRGTA